MRGSDEQLVKQVADYGEAGRRERESEARRVDKIRQTSLENAERREWAQKKYGDEKKVELLKQEHQRR